MADELPDGVYLNLDEETYFAQKRLGSTDICKLALTGAGWWWSSFHNPDFEPEKEDTKPKVFGKGLHARTLEGEKAYRQRFGIIPTKAEMAKEHGERFCVTVKDITDALEARGMNPKGGQPKAWYIEYARTRAPDLVIWEEYEERWARQNKGRLPLTGPEDRQLAIMSEAILDHPEVGRLFKRTPDNRPLAEVSVLFTDENGLRRRVRYDDLLPDTTVDLKALSNIGGRPLSWAVGEHVGRYAYYCQLADHQAARKWLNRLVSEGHVAGGSKEDRQWLARFPAEASKTPEYAWIFFQRPDARAGLAPVVFPWIEDFGSDLHMDGVRARHRAIQTYLQCSAQFGLDKPWTVVAPVHTTAEGWKHRVYVPHWTAQEAYAGEREDL